MEDKNLDKLTWKIIDKLFTDNPNMLTSHHIDSYNNFFNKNIYNIFREKNPIKINYIYEGSSFILFFDSVG